MSAVRQRVESLAGWRRPDPASALMGPEVLVVACALAAAGVLGLALSGLFPLPVGPREILFVVGGLILGAVGFARPLIGIPAVVAVFTFSAFFRRVIPAANPSADFAAIVPFLVALPLAARAISIKKPVPVAVFLGWVTVAAVWSLLHPLVSIAGWLEYAIPLLVALVVWRTPSGVRVLARWTVVCGVIAATYGIAQYLMSFSWDVRWLEESKFVSAGGLAETTLRPFSTLPAPRTAAILSGVVILLVLYRRELTGLGAVGRGWALTSCTIFLLLTQVRAIWLSVAAALFVGAVSAGRYRVRRILVPSVIVVLAVTFLPQGQVILSRATTLLNLKGDISYQSRIELLRQAGQFASPLGRGLGTLSSGNRVNEGTSLENGYIVIMGETGVIGLGLFLWMLAANGRALRREEYPFFAMLVLSSFGGFIFGGFSGVILWPLAALGREQISAEVSSATVSASG